MNHISLCFNWFLDEVENHFISSDHPRASLVIDQVVVIRDSGVTKERFELLSNLMSVEER